MVFQSIPTNTIKFIPINNQKTGVNNSFLMPNRIASNNKTITPTNIQKKVGSVIILNPEPRSLKAFSWTKITTDCFAALAAALSNHFWTFGCIKMLIDSR